LLVASLAKRGEGAIGSFADAPLVSVILPVRNGDRWLGDAIACVLSQTLGRLELIIVDDGSDDELAERLEALPSRDRRIRVFRQGRHGLVAALNKGLSVARAPYFARLDADDLAHERRLERQSDFLTAYPNIGVLGTWTIDIDAAGRRLKIRKPPSDPAALKRLLAHGNPLVHSSIMARTKLVRDLGGYRAAFEAAEDYDLWLRVAEVSEVANLSEPLACYRVHSDGVSAAESLRQSFSVRLAQRSAAARQAQLPDPAEQLQGPPDWRYAADGAFADDFALYQWLDPAFPAPSFAAAPSQLDGLNHAERRLAALSVLKRLRSADVTECRRSRAVLLRLLRERPRMVINAAWSLCRQPANARTGRPRDCGVTR
jgi:GT2 family glycosyltransferase